jgi:hypothetical protein
MKRIEYLGYDGLVFVLFNITAISNYHSKKGSSLSFTGGVSVSESGYGEKHPVSPSPLVGGMYGGSISFLSNCVQLSPL